MIGPCLKKTRRFRLSSTQRLPWLPLCLCACVALYLYVNLFVFREFPFSWVETKSSFGWMASA